MKGSTISTLEELQAELETVRRGLDQARFDLSDANDEVERLGSALAVAESERDALRKALEKTHVAFHEGEELHEEGCPQDDTCNCPLNVEICMALYGVGPGRNVPARAALSAAPVPGDEQKHDPKTSDRLERFGDLDKLDDLANGRITLGQYQGKPPPAPVDAQCPRCLEAMGIATKMEHAMGCYAPINQVEHCRCGLFQLRAALSPRGGT